MKNPITEINLKEAKRIIEVHEAYERKIAANKLLPIISDDEIIQYKDFVGNWYIYEKYLQENPYFYPELGIRVVKTNH